MIDFSTFKHEYTKSVFSFEAPTSGDYRVYANGKAVPVYTCRISAFPFNSWWPGHQRNISQSEIASFVNLVTDEDVELTVEPLTKKDYGKVMIKPYAKGVTPRTRDGMIAFTLRENGGYVLELDDYHGLLYIFNNKPQPCPSPKDVTYYFGSGVHFPGKITLKSNESVYLHKDALVYGCIYAENAENIHIFGNGIFDDSCEERITEHCYEAYTNGNIKFYDCKNIRVEGVGFTNSAIWCVNLFHCFDVVLDRINVFGQWRYNTDGVDIVNCQRVTVKNSFIHSFDDTVTIKGIDRYGYESNVDILTEGCVLWCDWGRTMEIGLESECPAYQNIVFRDCHVIRGGNTVCDIQNGDCAHVHDVTFENISMELESFYTKEILQKSEDQVYAPGDETSFAALMRISNNRFRQAYAFLGVGSGNASSLGQPSYAGVDRIRVKNVRIFADSEIMSRLDGRCVTVKIRNIIPTTEYGDIDIENVVLNGRRLSEDDMNIVLEGVEKEALTVK